MAHTQTSKALTSHRQAESAKPADRPYSLNAGDGLFLKVMPNGTKKWVLRYFMGDGKEKTLSLGLFPSVGLAEAREGRDSAKKLVAKGINPSEKRKYEKAHARLTAANTFKAVAQEWLERQSDKAPTTQAKGAWLLQFAIAHFGQKPIKDVTAQDVLAACRELEAKDMLETAGRVRSKCSQVFRYAVQTARADRDPTTDLKGALRPPAVKHRAAIIEPARVGQLLRDIDQYSGQITTVCALKLAPLLFIRPGELRSAQWADIDLDAKQWRFTPPKTRNQTRLELIVPLPDQAVDILKTLQPITGHRPYVFFSTGKDGHLSEAAILQALRRMKYSGDDMSGHGFRAMARTLLEEVLQFPIEIIEQQLGHQVRDPLGRAYNRTKHLGARAKMMQAWADYLDELKTQGAPVR